MEFDAKEVRAHLSRREGSGPAPRPYKATRYTQAKFKQTALLVESGGGRDAEFCGNSLGRGLAGAGNGLAAAYPNVYRAGDDATNAFVVHGAQVAVVKSERDGLRSRRGKMDALESSK